MDSIRIIFDERILDLNFDVEFNCVKIVLDSEKVSFPFYFNELEMLLDSLSDKYVEINFVKK